MYKLMVLSMVTSLAAGMAFAQSEQHKEAQSLLEGAGVNLEIPADASTEQVAQIIALVDGSSNKGSNHIEFEVKKILGTE